MLERKERVHTEVQLFIPLGKRKDGVFFDGDEADKGESAGFQPLDSVRLDNFQMSVQGELVGGQGAILDAAASVQVQKPQRLHRAGLCIQGSQ